MDKKIRFGDLVRNSGRPQVITLWTKPEENRALTTAIKHNRVLTVIQEPRKRDYGVIGFELHPGASYLVFPRPLPQTKGRVIGINYQLVEEPVFTMGSVAREEKPSRERQTPKPALPKPVIKKFRIRLRRTACLESEISVEAASKEAAERQAVEAVKGKPFEVSKAQLQTQIVKTE
jgi:hypothetical protein